MSRRVTRAETRERPDGRRPHEIYLSDEEWGLLEAIGLAAEPDGTSGSRQGPSLGVRHLVRAWGDQGMLLAQAGLLAASRKNF